MSELVERVAAAIAEHVGYDGMCGAIARAAIVAMREPTEAMKDAGFSEACRHDSGDSYPAPTPSGCRG